ncbi:MAG: DnaD domain protein [Oscillospiraceae bacterium]
MNYRVSPSAWSNAFAVPAQIVDKHIKIASGQQLKVFLWLLRHSADEPDISKLAKGVGMTEADVCDNMQYWIEAGLAIQDGQGSAPAKVQKAEDSKEVKEPKAELEPQSDKKQLLSLPDITPTHEQVAKRVMESPELKYLYLEAQAKLGKTIGYDTQAKLLMIHDHYGLPVEIILTIIEYAVLQGKPSMAYISKVGKDWGEREINTLEKADELLKSLCEDEKRWRKFCSMFSVDPPKHTEKRNELLKKWNQQLGFSLEMIYLAYEETLNNINKVNFTYTDSILQNWSTQKVKTPADIAETKDERSKKFADKKQTNTGGSSASYDLNKFREKARGPIEYKRRDG